MRAHLHVGLCHPGVCEAEFDAISLFSVNASPSKEASQPAKTEEKPPSSPTAGEVPQQVCCGAKHGVSRLFVGLLCTSSSQGGFKRVGVRCNESEVQKTGP